MTLDEALQSRREVQQRFERVLKQKIESIKYAYSKDKLSEKQLAFLKRDEEFCKASEEMANKLIAQINFLMQENNEQKLFMQGLMKDVDKWQEQYINLCLEYNQMRFDKLREEGNIRFDFEKGLNT